MLQKKFTSRTPLYGFVVVHDEDVDDVEQHQAEGFVPFNPLVVDDADENGYCHSIGEAIPR